VGQLFAGRIGHFVPDALEHFLRAELSPTRTHDYFYFFGGISNSQWAKMVSRNLSIKGKWLKNIWYWNKFLPGGDVHNLPQTYTESRDTGGLFNQFKQRFDFLEIENDFSRQWLKSKGWKNGEPFICLQVRDSLYLAEFDSANPKDPEQIAHSYRDSNIETYVEAIEWLISEGFWVIRMGKLAKKKLPIRHEKLIDYAFEDSKSDLLDIWLVANCSFCISTSTGPDWISIAYGKPVLFINALPLGGLFSFAKSMWIPKKLIWKSTRKELTLNEILDTTHFQTSDYINNGIMIQALTAKEILLGVKEFAVVVEKIQNMEDISDYRDDIFWKHFLAWNRYSDLHGYLHEESFVSRNWLKTRPIGFYE